MTRREMLLGAPAFLQNRPQRAIVFLIDGLGDDYIAASQMPVLKSWQRKGIGKTISGVMPSVTNANNATLCCGTWPDQHGITANFFLDEATGKELYMESADLVLRPTLFEKAARLGMASALLSSKKKTIGLLNRGARVVMSAEIPPAEWTARLGPAPGIYSAAINHWLLKSAIWLLKNQRDLGVVYVHTTDYPMHMWPPGAPESKEHLAQLDALFGELAEAAPDAAILLAADHGMNSKTRCWDLALACAARGVPLRSAISAEQDKYLKHHRGFGGTAWVYLKSPKDTDQAARVMRGLTGVEAVLTREEAARRFHLMPSRIGDLVVLGDRETVFGGLDSEFEKMAPEYRSHGGLSEARVPMVVYNAIQAPAPKFFESTPDVTRWLYAGV
jgi:phosphonoacetate hydrolase